MGDPAAVEHMAVEGVEAVTSKPEEFAVRVKNEIEKWGKVARTAGIKAD